MKNVKCSKGFPKPFREETTINEDSYANLRRRNTGKKYQVGDHEVDNHWVVPYPHFYLWKFRCHINMECILSIKAIKYIYKYVYKGHDRTTMEFGTCQDEIKLIWIPTMCLPVRAYGDCISLQCMRNTQILFDFRFTFQTSN